MNVFWYAVGSPDFSDTQSRDDDRIWPGQVSPVPGLFSVPAAP